MIGDSEQLQRSIGYTFSNKALLTAALTHCSAGRDNNERLEFLGDAILGMVIADALYAKFPEASEGELSRMRASLVRGESLTELAQKILLGDYLHLGQGELKSGGFRRASILADAFEALLAAIYLDSGSERCREFVLAYFADRLEKVSPAEAGKDPKTRLQELLQSRHMSLPDYDVVATSGESHNQVFTVECRIDNAEVVQATGTSRRKAEQAAAERILETIFNE